MVSEIVPLWAHQKEAVSKAIASRDFAFLMDMGTGKSLTTVTTLRNKYAQHKRVLRTLIVTPPITLKNWKNEWDKGSKVGDRVRILHGHRKQRLAAIKGGEILLTNYESLVMPDVYKALTEWAPEILVFDESSRIKSYKSKRTKAAIKLAQIAKHRYILTGTPILNTPMDIFTQYLALDGGETFGANFFSFRNRYFYDANSGMPQSKYFPNWKVRPGALDDIRDKIYTKAMRVTKQECLDLPPLVRKTIHVELSKEQARAYEEMKKDFITYVGEKACVASIALTKALKLMQITTGFVQIEDKAHAMETTPRAKALKELLEDLVEGHKVIVWAVFKENYKTIANICKALNAQYVEIHGEISDTKKFEAVDLFNKDPKVRVLIGHPGSGGIGINLVSSDYAIYFSRNFSLEQDLQSEARNHRGGSEIHEKITRIDLVAQGTIDELIQEALAKKISISDKVLRSLASEL